MTVELAKLMTSVLNKQVIEIKKSEIMLIKVSLQFILSYN